MIEKFNLERPRAEDPDEAVTPNCRPGTHLCTEGLVEAVRQPTVPHTVLEAAR